MIPHPTSVKGEEECKAEEHERPKKVCKMQQCVEIDLHKTRGRER